MLNTNISNVAGIVKAGIVFNYKSPKDLFSKAQECLKNLLVTNPAIAYERPMAMRCEDPGATSSLASAASGVEC